MKYKTFDHVGKDMNKSYLHATAYRHEGSPEGLWKAFAGDTGNNKIIQNRKFINNSNTNN